MTKGEKRKPFTTDAQIKSASKIGRHPCGDSFYLDVKKPYYKLNDKGEVELDSKGHPKIASQAKAFVLRVSVAGKIVERGLGAYSQVGLKEAREKAKEWAIELRRGHAVGIRANKPPATSTGAVVTFMQAATQVMALRDASWKSDVHRNQWRASLENYAYPLIGNKPVGEVTLDDVEAVLLPIWQTKHATATKVLSRMGMVLDWAIAKKLRTDNPAKANGPLKHLLPVVKRSTRHHAALPYKDAAPFMVQLRALESMSSLALQFTILTACRTSEVIEAKWSEIDFDTALWVVPAHRMKNGKEHRVPLSPAAIAVLETAAKFRGVENWVFQGRSSHLSNMAMAECLKGLRTGLTVHGFRSTFRDWAGEIAQAQWHAAEAALAHTTRGQTEGAYHKADYLDARVPLMNDWACFLTA